MEEKIIKFILVDTTRIYTACIIFLQSCLATKLLGGCFSDDSSTRGEFIQCILLFL